MIDLKRYIRTHIEHEILPTEAHEEVIVGWKKALPIDLGPTLNELYELADRVEPIKRPGKLKEDYLTFRVSLREIKKDFYRYAEEEKKKDASIKRIPDYPDSFFINEIYEAFPDITRFWEKHEYHVKDKDGVNELDKKGDLKKITETNLIFKGIKLRNFPLKET